MRKETDVVDDSHFKIREIKISLSYEEVSLKVFY